MVIMTDLQIESTADRIVVGFDKINEKVDTMRAERLNDPDSLGDKLLKAALPSIAGFVAGKVFTVLWNRGTSRRKSGAGTLGDGVVDDHESFVMSLLFSALSAAIGAVVSQLSDRGSQAIVDRRHRKQGR